MKCLSLHSRVLAAATALLLSTPLLAQSSAANSDKSETWRSVLDHNFPRLVVVMSFDQFRADLLSRLSHQFLPAYSSDGDVGGFRWLMENGAAMVDNHYNHVPMHTGPGHATIMTGAAPRLSGIIGNDWGTSTGLRVNCVGDPDAHTIGPAGINPRKGSSSPRNLLAQTVGDALKISNNSLSKVYGIAVKDRGAILPSGHNANGAVWYDSGKWVSSTWYTTSTLPTFAQRFNELNVSDRWLGEEWDYLLPKEAYKISMPEGMKGVGEGRGMPATFPKPLSEPGQPANKDYYNKLIMSPFGNEMVFETAKMAVQYEELGQDIYPDILTLSFSTLDLIGHTWGTNSPESHDTILRADRQLANFFKYLDNSVAGGLDNVLIVVTGDHGGATLPEWLQEMRAPSERIMYDVVADAAEAALAAAFPDKQTTGLIQFGDPAIVFRTAQFEKRGIDTEAAAEVVAKGLRNLRGISAAYTRKQIESGDLPRTQFAQMVTNGFNPHRSGDVIVLSDQFFYNSRSKTGSTHGTPYNYDTQVPLLFAGSAIKPGVYTNRTDERDIAPTLSFLLGISAPASSEGRILGEIIR